jgi:hypothetical protein
MNFLWKKNKKISDKLIFYVYLCLHIRALKRLKKIKESNEKRNEKVDILRIDDCCFGFADVLYRKRRNNATFFK